ncbi:hypothetical protein AJ79_01924 [Helicocarpus griseus UAMH5409]|uniref:TauD/TfdA-like domain-containing protein n=1 Tax=Helicocarpus griseus UAMH5409 TaxID=1447875 RepID=A0A2B7Y693_9EURO|nr:hypothetical protein AJ79_01924 [Helicocarpus griseus UAMH5409]
MSLALAPLRQARPTRTTTWRLQTARNLLSPSIPLLRASYSDAAEPASLGEQATPENNNWVIRKTPVTVETPRRIEPVVRKFPEGRAVRSGAALSKPTNPTEPKPLVRFTGIEKVGRDTSLVIKEIRKISLNKEGHLLVHGSSQYPARINSIRLRDACTCPRCVDPSTKQREFRMSDIPADVRIRSAGIKDGQLFVTWKNDIPGFDESHTSTFTHDRLTTLTARERVFLSRAMPRQPWSGSDMEKSQHWVSFKDYIEDDSEFFKCMRSLCLYGLVFIKDIPESPEMVEKIATRMGPLRNSFYGQTWDVRSVPDAKNVAYTNKHLDFHMDLLYMKNPPGYQILHCLKNSMSGGESLFADTLRTAQHMRKVKPAFFEHLVTVPTRFEYKNNGEHYSFSHPTIEIEGGPEELKEQVGRKERLAVTHVNYSPPFQAPSHNSKHTMDDHNIEFHLRAQKYFTSHISDPRSIFQVKMEPGQAVIFANRRVVHARNAFDLSSAAGEKAESGERWLRGAYVDEDALQSKFRLMAEKDYIAWSKHASPFRVNP